MACVLHTAEEPIAGARSAKLRCDGRETTGLDQRHEKMQFGQGSCVVAWSG